MDAKRLHDNARGFTMIEILIVVVIIGILAAIAIPSLTRQRQKGYDTTAMSDIKNAYSAAQAYFSSYPDATLDLSKLESSGFGESKGVALTVVSGTQLGLNMTASHQSGSKHYTVDANGAISQ
ncbi:MAG: prepilin-type N-terminal cleavage/methylation domain-containing protein [Desulfobacterales bacterium]|nr:prepilin-type N-terminal cleavage/methylation domain-containing protein [Desulfobacterales bacterium]